MARLNAGPDSLAVITGATAGIGREFAEQLAKRGHSLLLIARDAARLQSTAAELTKAHSISVRFVPADLSRDEDIERVADALALERNLDILVNNAGFGSQGRFHEIDADVQNRMVHLHVVAVSRLSSAVLPGMVARGRGWLINVSSIAGFLYGPGNANYCATKGYEIQFTNSLDTELANTGVYVQALCPGFTHTEFHDRGKMDKRTVPDFLWHDARGVVSASIGAAERGRPRILVPGWKNKILALAARLSPHWVRRRGRPNMRRD